MRVYIAGTFETRAAVKKIQQLFIEHGHVITADWTNHKTIVHENPEDQKTLSREYAIEDVTGVMSADAFILLLGERKSTGVHLELGVALGANVPHIYLVGEIKDSSVFYAHPSIKQVGRVENVLAELDG